MRMMNVMKNSDNHEHNLDYVTDYKNAEIEK